jgi:hypothetical protein
VIEQTTLNKEEGGGGGGGGEGEGDINVCNNLHVPPDGLKSKVSHGFYHYSDNIIDIMHAEKQAFK